MSNQKGKFVYVVDEGGKAETRPIETGDWQEEQFLVTAGLKPGDRVVVSGALKLQPDMPVKVVEASAQPASQAAPPAEQQ